MRTVAVTSNGHVVQTSLSAGDEAALKEALEHQDVKETAADHLDKE